MRLHDCALKKQRIAPPSPVILLGPWNLLRYQQIAIFNIFSIGPGRVGPQGLLGACCEAAALSFFFMRVVAPNFGSKNSVKRHSPQNAHGASERTFLAVLTVFVAGLFLPPVCSLVLCCFLVRQRAFTTSTIST